ncbi:MAG: response regulator [Bacteroidota bacterium]
MATGTPINVLIVEDNPGDVELAKEALRETTLPLNVSVAGDGEEALALMQRDDVPAPDLVLLDLNMPRKSGHEVLEEMKADASLRLIPVVIFTSSSAREDIDGAYERHANCYITKPADLDELMGVVRAIEAFWLTVVRLPRRVIL